jgi:hypothetical protein
MRQFLPYLLFSPVADTVFKSRFGVFPYGVQNCPPQDAARSVLTKERSTS